MLEVTIEEGCLMEGDANNILIYRTVEGVLVYFSENPVDVSHDCFISLGIYSLL